MDAFYLYFAALYLVVFGLLVYQAVLKQPSGEQAQRVWLPALLLSLLGTGSVSGLAWLLLGTTRSEALLGLAADRLHKSSSVGGYGLAFVYLFTFCTLTLFVFVLRSMARAAKRRSEGSIVEAIKQWQDESKPPH